MLLNTTTNFRVKCQVISEKWPKKVILTFCAKRRLGADADADVDTLVIALALWD